MPLKVKVFGRHGSDYMKAIKGWLGNHKIAECNIAFNYGLQGQKLKDYHAKYPQLQRLPIFNHEHIGNKYAHVQVARTAGVPVPITCHKPEEYPYAERPDGFRWIAKPYYSLGGRDIDYHDEGNEVPNTHYVQQKIDNRRYEMRVHAWAWVDPKHWIFQKRVHEDGENVLCWNAHNGGKFITVENPDEPLFERLREDTKKLMKAFGYQFGAADFIVQNPGKKGKLLKHYFMEWNLAPGWTLDRTEKVYKENFEALQGLNREQVDLLMEGIYPWDGAWEERPEEPMLDLPPEEQVVVEIEEPQDWRRFRMPEPQRVPAPHIQHEMERIRELEMELAHLQREQEEADILRQRNKEVERFLEIEDEADDADRYAEVMEEAQMEMNFCPQCGRPVNRDIFGGLPRFCTSCGRKVRA
jgi:hypothetical protein